MQKQTVQIIRVVADALTQIGDILEPDAEQAMPAVKLDTVPAASPDGADAQAMAMAPVDSEGLPWDERIHSSGKTQYQKKSARAAAGTWTLKRNVSDDEVGLIKMELIGGTQVEHAAPGVPEPDPHPLAPAAAEMQAPQAPPAPTPPVEIKAWGDLMKAIVGAGIQTETVTAACQKFNVEDLSALQNVPILVPVVAKELGLI